MLPLEACRRISATAKMATGASPQSAAKSAKKLAQAGLSFSYHNHSFEFVKFAGRTGLEILFEDSDARYLQAELDTYWVQHGGADPVAWIRRLDGRIPVIHLKDMVMLPPPSQSPPPPPPPPP